ncbi:MAG: LPS assembly protein LptD [Pyrinomonadaceae bacterium]
MLASARTAVAQQTNRVDRQVTNPITDTPNVNPLTQELLVQPRPAPAKSADPADLTTDELKITARQQEVTGVKGAQVYVYSGDVDARIGVYRLQADKVTVVEAANKLIAEGNVVFDQGAPFASASPARAANSTTPPSSATLKTPRALPIKRKTAPLYFTADASARALDTIVATNVQVTACEDIVPVELSREPRGNQTGDRVKLRAPSFRVKDIPIMLLPYASVPIKRRDRASGILTPTVSYSGEKGLRLSGAYYQTLGRSADLTVRGDVYTGRGLGLGADLRTRANSRSYLNLGFFAVKDRMFGPAAGPEHPDQGGSSFYAEGVHYFSNGFLAAADVNITSNLSYRQVFSDNVQQVISPDERSQVFINKNFSDYSLNFLARTNVTSIPNVRVRTRQLPSVSFEKRPSALRFFENHPVYFSFGASFDGVSRKETVEDIAAFKANGGDDIEPIVSPSMVQRLDLNPRVSLPLYYQGWSFTATVGARATYYSNSIDPATRLGMGRDVTRGFVEFEGDLRPPALARNFYRGDRSLRFRHVIEPYLTYRKITGVNNFQRIIRFDYLDTIAETNEFEYGVTNRFFTKRSTERVSGSNAFRAEQTVDKTSDAAQPTLSGQPNEVLSITLRNKYFFDPTFGGALIPGRRNQFYPITTFSGFTYGGVARRFSPLAIEARYRPAAYLLADVRTDFDTQGEGFRNLSVTFGIARPLVEAVQTFYYTRAIGLASSLQQPFAGTLDKEPGTLRGSQWSPALFVGNRARGIFGGVSFFFDFQNRPGKGSNSLISSTETIGYAFDCCAVTMQHYSFNVGLRNENRFLFSFRLNGIGTFGTEQIGQRFR